MSGRFASLHAGLLLRDRPRVAPPPRMEAEPAHSAVVRPFPAFVAPPRPAAEPAPAPSPSVSRRRAFTMRFDDAQYALLQIAKRRFGMSGQRLLLLALERLMGTGGR